jgi:glycosyltransferase involved in cell wall biosynthesis
MSAQSYSEFEALVIDDGSSDATPQIVAEFSRKDPRFRLIQLPAPSSGGPARARNVGVSSSTGSLIVFSDDDDPMLPAKIQTLVDIVNVLPNDRYWIAHDFVVVDESEKHLAERGLAEYSHLQAQLREPIAPQAYFVAKDDILAVCLRTSIVRGSTFAVSRASLYRSRPFDEQLKNGDDLDFVMSTSRYANCVFVDKPLSIYRQRQGNISSRRMSQLAPSRIRVLRRQQRQGLTAPQVAAFRDILGRTYLSWGFDLKLHRHFVRAAGRYLQSYWYQPSVGAIKGLLACVLRHSDPADLR